MQVFNDVKAALTGENVAGNTTNYIADRSETIVKKLPWSLRGSYHAHGPEINVSAINAKHFDPDPDMELKRRRGAADRQPLVILHFNDVYEIKEGKQVSGQSYSL